MRFVCALCGSFAMHAWVAADMRGAHRIVAPGVPDSPMEVRLVRATSGSEAARPRLLPSIRVPGELAVTNTPESPETARKASEEKKEESPRRRVPREPPTFLPRVADSTYYTAEQIDVYPSLLAPLAFDAVPALLGEIVVRLRLDEVGKLTHLAVLQSDSGGAAEEALRAVFSAAKFSAARRNGFPVKSEIVVRVLPDSRSAAPATHPDAGIAEPGH